MTTPSRSKRTPAFQFYPSDFLSSSKVRRMSMTERGVYITLLATCWLDNGLPTDLKTLAAMLHIPARQFERMWAQVLNECFYEKSGKLQNARLDIERKKQAEYSKQQADRINKRWERDRNTKGGNTTVLQEPNQVGNTLQSSSSSSSSSSESTHTQARAPIHQPHHKHAACGRVCVPADLHARFVRSLNRDDADRVLRDWYLDVDNEWSVGAHKDTPTGGNDYQFWRLRFDEKWPAPTQTRVRSRLADWQPKEAM